MLVAFVIVLLQHFILRPASCFFSFQPAFGGETSFTVGSLIPLVCGLWLRACPQTCIFRLVGVEHIQQKCQYCCIFTETTYWADSVYKSQYPWHNFVVCCTITYTFFQGSSSVCQSLSLPPFLSPPSQVTWPTGQVTCVGQLQAQVWQVTGDMWHVTPPSKECESNKT